MSYSVQAAITKYHRLCGLKTYIYFSLFSRLGFCVSASSIPGESPVADGHCVLTWWREREERERREGGGRASSEAGAFSYTGTNSIMGSPLHLNLMTTLGVRVST